MGFSPPPPTVIQAPSSQTASGSQEVKPYAPVEPLIQRYLPTLEAEFTAQPRVFAPSLVPTESAEAMAARQAYGATAGQVGALGQQYRDIGARELAMGASPYDPIYQQRLAGIMPQLGAFGGLQQQALQRAYASPMQDPLYQAEVGQIARQARELTERDKRLAQQQAIEAGQYGVGSTALGELQELQRQTREESAQRALASALGSAEQRRVAQAGVARQLTGDLLQAGQLPSAALAEAERRRQLSIERGMGLQQAGLQAGIGQASLLEGLGQTVEQRRAAQLADEARRYQQGQEAYRQQLVNYANLLGGLAGLGTSVGYQSQAAGVQPFVVGGGPSPFSQVMSAAGTFARIPGISDIRLKKDIKRIGKLSNGINLYTWKWNDIGKKLANGTPEIGVLAQEVQIVNPDAVITRPDGYLMVNYGRL